MLRAARGHQALARTSRSRTSRRHLRPRELRPGPGRPTHLARRPGRRHRAPVIRVRPAWRQRPPQGRRAALLPSRLAAIRARCLLVPRFPQPSRTAAPWRLAQHRTQRPAAGPLASGHLRRDQVMNESTAQPPPALPMGPGSPARLAGGLREPSAESGVSPGQKPISVRGAVSTSGWVGRRRAGPYPRLRVDFGVKVHQGLAVAELVLGRGFSFRQAAVQLDMSVTTAWRRFWWLFDYQLPERWGCRRGPLPPMRGTRACPRGRPYMPTLDGPGGPLSHLHGGSR